MIEGSKLWIERLAAGIEVGAALVVGLAAFEALVRALAIFIRRNSLPDTKVSLRLTLGRWLGVGLEFALAADILRTAVAPSWRDIGQLAAIAVLRTALNFTLEREVERFERPAADFEPGLR